MTTKMNKLALALSAIALSTTTSAANLSWDVFGALNDAGNSADWYTGGQAYLILVSDAASFSIADDLSITGGSVIQSTNVIGGRAKDSIDGASIGTGLINGETYKFAVLSTTEGTAGFSMPTSGLYGVNDNEGAFYSVTWSDTQGGSFNNWTEPAAVNAAIAPEPTSGLLILLGVAGLALKRKTNTRQR